MGTRNVTIEVHRFFSELRARINEELAKSNFDFFFQFHEKNTKKLNLLLIKERRSAFLEIKIFKKCKRVNEHPWATTEASDGSRPPRSAAASGRLFLPAAA